LRKDGRILIPDRDIVERCDRMIATAIQAFGRIDMLINNASILRDMAFRNMTDSDY
jgi:multifunctional beta-oxidation protein